MYTAEERHERFAALKAANAKLSTVNIRGKQYAQVTERVKAFREMCPCGVIETEILDLSDGVVTMKATIRDDSGNLIATGLAQEKESNSQINKTSFIENCETSAVGRALGFAGIGIDASMASAEEVATAMTNQNKISAKEQAALKALAERKGLDIATTFPFGLGLTAEQYAEAVKRIGALADK